MSNSIEKIAKTLIWLGVALSFILPFVVDDMTFFPFVAPKSFIFMGAAQIIFFSWLILAMTDKKYRLKKSIVFWAVILFIASSFISTFLGVDPPRSFWSKYERMTGFLMQIHALMYFIGLSSTFKSRKDWRYILSGSVFLSMIMGFIFLAYKFNPSVAERFANSQGGLFLGNKSFMGTYLMFNAFFALCLLLSEWFEKKRNNILLGFFGFAFVLIGIVMKLANTRAMFFSYLGGIAFFAVLFAYFNWEEHRKITKWILIAFVLFAVSFLVSVFWAESPLNNIYDINEAFIKSGGGARLLIWKSIMPQIMEKPLFGWGPENFELAFYKQFDPKLFLPEWGTEIWFDRAHNVFVDYLVSHGFIGTLLYISIFLASAWYLFKKHKKDMILFVTMVPLLAAYLIQNATVFDMVSSILVFYLALSFINSYNEEEESQPINFGTAEVMKLVGIILIFLFCLNVFVIRGYAGSRSVINMIVSYQAYGSKDSRAVERLDKVYGENHRYTNKYTAEDVQKRMAYFENVVEAANYGKHQNRDFLSDIFIKSTTNDIQQIPQIENEEVRNIIIRGVHDEYLYWVNKCKQSVEESPYDYRAQLRYARIASIYIARFKPENALDVDGLFVRAEELSPNNPNTYWMWAQMYLDMGDKQKALEITERAIDIAPQVPRSYTTVLDLAKELYDYPLIEEVKQKAITAFEKEKETSTMPEWWDAQIEVINSY